jgi:hypothetical protein
LDALMLAVLELAALICACASLLNERLPTARPGIAAQ